MEFLKYCTSLQNETVSLSLWNTPKENTTTFYIFLNVATQMLSQLCARLEISAFVLTQKNIAKAELALYNVVVDIKIGRFKIVVCSKCIPLLSVPILLNIE